MYPSSEEGFLPETEEDPTYELVVTCWVGKEGGKILYSGGVVEVEVPGAESSDGEGCARACEICIAGARVGSPWVSIGEPAGP
jgi:hypothetical protein